MQRCDTPYCSGRSMVIQSGMSERDLVVIMGALSRTRKAKAAQLQDALAKRWRMAADGLLEPLTAPRPAEPRDVIPLLDGWIRRLEREAGPNQTQSR